MGETRTGFHLPFDLTHLGQSTGTYVLLLALPAPQRILVGRLGVLAFPSGWYAYAGSARGPGGLAARLRHHLRIARRPHWHVDYLRARSLIADIWYSPSQHSDEHRWTACLQAMAEMAPVAPGFGSSDCRCATHLVAFLLRPSITRFRKRLRDFDQGRNVPVYCIRAAPHRTLRRRPGSS